MTIAWRDLTGQQFGRLRVDGLDENRKGDRRWRCVCSCGATCVVYGAALRGGQKTHCGRACRDLEVENLVGKTFGRLTVMTLAVPASSGKARRWEVRAFCGHTKIIEEARLRQNPPTTCGASACRWSLIDVGGRLVTKQSLAQELGVSDSAIDARLRAGWTIDEIVAGHRTGKTPVRSITIEYEGEHFTLGELARRHGMTTKQLDSRLRVGGRRRHRHEGKL